MCKGQSLVALIPTISKLLKACTRFVVGVKNEFYNITNSDFELLFDHVQMRLCASVRARVRVSGIRKIGV